MPDIPTSLRRCRASARSASGPLPLGLGLLVPALAAPGAAGALPAARPAQEARDAAGGGQGGAGAEPAAADSVPDRLAVTRAVGEMDRSLFLELAYAWRP